MREDSLVYHLVAIHELQRHHLDGILTMARPQDLNSLPLSNTIQSDFRFKGYPGENFFKSKVPQYKRMSADINNGPETSRFFGKSQHFDTVKKPVNPIATKPTEHDPIDSYRGHLVEEARPRVDDGPRNYQYGSDSHAPNPGPMRGLGYDNSMEREREKNHREAMDADHDIKRARQQEELRQMERLEERRRDMEMLKNYNPWGRPGGGAPRDDNRKQKFTEFQLTPRPNELVYKDNWEPAYPEIENLDFKNLDMKNGYMPSGPGDRTRYHQNGEDMQRKQDELRQQDNKLEQLKNELDYLKNSARETEAMQNQDSFATARNNGYGDYRARAPESSRSSQQFYDEYDDVGIIGKAKKPNRFQPKIYHPFNKPGGGAPLMDHSGKIVTVLHGHSDLTAEQKRQEAIKAKLYHKDLDELYQTQQRKKRMDREDQTKPFGEFAAIMDDKIVGKPRRNPITGQLENHHLGQSDVSLLKIGAVKSDRNKQANYHNELDSLTSEKKKSMQLHRLKDNQEGIQHHYTMEQTFGRPGGGAPKGDHLQKLHLDTIIHHPSKDKATEEYIRSKDWSEVEPEKFFKNEEEDYYYSKSNNQKNPLNSWREEPEGRYSPQHPLKYVRSTVTSNHANQYDYRDDYPKKEHKIGAPYATFGDRMV